MLLSSCTRDDAGSSGRSGGHINFIVSSGGNGALTKSASSDVQTYDLYYNLTTGEQSDTPLSAKDGGRLSASSVSSATVAETTASEDFGKFTITVEPNDGVFHYAQNQTSTTSEAASEASNNDNTHEISSNLRYGDKITDPSGKAIHQYLNWEVGDLIIICQSDKRTPDVGTKQGVYEVIEAGTPQSNGKNIAKIGFQTPPQVYSGSKDLKWLNEEQVFIAAHFGSSYVATNRKSFFLAAEDYPIKSLWAQAMLGTMPVNQVAIKNSSATNVYEPELDKYGIMTAFVETTPVSSLSLEFTPAFSAIEFSLKSEAGVTMKLNSVQISSTTTNLTHDAYAVGYRLYVTLNPINPVNTRVFPSYDSEHMGTIPHNSYKYANLTFKDSDGTTDVTPTINSTAATSFVMLLSGAEDLTNLTVTFNVDITEGGVTQTNQTRKLELKQGTTPITIPACSKVLISNLTMPSDLYDYKFIVTDPTDLSYVGGTSTTGKITSYKTLKSGSGPQEPLAVSIDGNYFYDTYEKAVAGLSADRTPIASGNFISSITPSVSGINTSLTIGYLGTTNQGTVTYSASDLNAKIASKASMGGSSNYINLSNPNDLSTNVGSNTIVETANTYIVNGAGYYKIPLVMGNGIKNGKLNPTAYKQSGFVNYMGDAMTSRTTPYLQDNSLGATGVPTSAYIVWADKNFIEVENTTNCVIQSGSTTINAISSTTSGGQQVYWLNFHVNDATTQAVAVIGIRDQNNTTMWSYTIWLTDYVPANYPGYGSSEDPDVEVTSYSDDSNPEGTPLKVTLMPRDLGWVETTTTAITSNYYEGQEAYVRVKQAETDDIKVVKIFRPRSATQSGARSGYSPYYQWGRKDALLPSNGTVNTNLSAVGKNASLATASSTTLANVIKGPHTFYYNTSTYDWTTSTGNNGWWCAGNTATSVDLPTVKTIYDPSPAGYTIPRYNAYLSFRTGTSGSAPNSTNEAFSSVKGYYFYTGYRATSSASTDGMGTIFFPAAGFRYDGSEGPAYIGSSGYYWSAVPFSADDGRRLTFASSGVYPQYYDARTYGFCVRPQRDEL
ncbi:MAG: hypothetical protein IKI67_05320 [Bacteroidales bacterium]|nr:hypothetical protein [Bacteroidales bacterium]